MSVAPFTLEGKNPPRATGMVHVADAVTELRRLLNLPAPVVDWTGSASCVRCHGTGEVGTYREPDTGEWVTRECGICGGYGLLAAVGVA